MRKKEDFPFCEVKEKIQSFKCFLNKNQKHSSKFDYLDAVKTDVAKTKPNMDRFLDSSIDSYSLLNSVPNVKISGIKVVDAKPVDMLIENNICSFAFSKGLSLDVSYSIIPDLNCSNFANIENKRSLLKKEHILTLSVSIIARNNIGIKVLNSMFSINYEIDLTNSKSNKKTSNIKDFNREFNELEKKLAVDVARVCFKDFKKKLSFFLSKNDLSWIDVLNDTLDFEENYKSSKLFRL